jgi:hypothetical protein
MVIRKESSPWISSGIRKGLGNAFQGFYKRGGPVKLLKAGTTKGMYGNV